MPSNILKYFLSNNFCLVFTSNLCGIPIIIGLSIFCSSKVVRAPCRTMFINLFIFQADILLGLSLCRLLMLMTLPSSDLLERGYKNLPLFSLKLVTSIPFLSLPLLILEKAVALRSGDMVTPTFCNFCTSSTSLSPSSSAF